MLISLYLSYLVRQYFYYVYGMVVIRDWGLLGGGNNRYKGRYYKG